MYTSIVLQYKRKIPICHIIYSTNNNPLFSKQNTFLQLYKQWFSLPYYTRKTTRTTYINNCYFANVQIASFSKTYSTL